MGTPSRSRDELAHELSQERAGRERAEARCEVLERRQEAIQAVLDAALGGSAFVEARVQATRAMERQQEPLARITENVPAAIAYMSRDLVYEWVNPRHAQLLPQALVGKSILEVFGEGDAAQIGPLMRQVLDTGEPYYEKGSVPGHFEP